MVGHLICILADPGDLLGGLCSRTHTWMPALDILDGITGAKLKMREALASTSTGILFHTF